MECAKTLFAVDTTYYLCHEAGLIRYWYKVGYTDCGVKGRKGARKYDGSGYDETFTYGIAYELDAIMHVELSH